MRARVLVRWYLHTEMQMLYSAWKKACSNQNCRCWQMYTNCSWHRLNLNLQNHEREEKGDCADFPLHFITSHLADSLNHDTGKQDTRAPIPTPFNWNTITLTKNRFVSLPAVPTTHSFRHWKSLFNPNIYIRQGKIWSRVFCITRKCPKSEIRVWPFSPY